LTALGKVVKAPSTYFSSYSKSQKQFVGAPMMPQTFLGARVPVIGVAKAGYADVIVAHEHSRCWADLFVGSPVRIEQKDRIRTNGVSPC
jgi:hypothetical protein